jgi:glycolate oxidase FAD binding subunit
MHLLAPARHELSDLVQELHGQGRSWLPAGLGSRLDWGPPVATDTVVSCRQLDRILEHNPEDFTIAVEAGTPLVEVQLELRRHGQWLALDPAWGSPQGSIGGLVARGLAGGYRQRHLGVRDQLIGIHVLRADGVRAKAGGRVVKNVAGYDLMRLFCGSWGSLGLITAVHLRTQPLPPRRRGLRLEGDAGSLAGLAGAVLASSLSPERIDWWSGPLAAAAGLAARPQLLLGLASVDEATLDEQIAALRGWTSLPMTELATETLEHLQEFGRGLDGTAADGTASPWLLRLGVDPAAVDRLLVSREVEGLAIEIGAGSGLGMAWCLPQNGGTPATPAQVLALRRRCAELGGFLTVLRQPASGELPAWQDAPSRPLIEAVKRQFDPRQQLAPGRLPGVAFPGTQAKATT